jgi:AraC-like DNA-binding protein
MTLTIDTGAVSAADRVAFWANSQAEIYHPLRIATDAADRFQARLWGEWMASVGFFRISATGNTMIRTWRDIVLADPECLHVALVLRGHMQAAQDQRECVVGPGDITSYDTSQPVTLHAVEPFELLVLKLPRSALGSRAEKMSQLTAVPISGASGVPRMASRFFASAAAGLSDGTISTDDSGVAELTLDLVRRLYSDLHASHRCQPRSRTDLVQSAQRHIVEHLSDADLDIDQIARACFISPRYLQRLFAEAGLSVSGWIRSERMARCRRDLSDSALADDPIATIARRWGMPSAPHFSRLFRSTYGCSPREFRKAALVDAMPQGVQPAVSATTVTQQSTAARISALGASTLDRGHRGPRSQPARRVA